MSIRIGAVAVLAAASAGCFRFDVGLAPNEAPRAAAPALLEPVVGTTVVLDGSEGVVSPDNIDLNRHGELVICEDPSPDLRAIRGRERTDTRLWVYDTRTDSLWPALEVNRGYFAQHGIQVCDRVTLERR